MLQGTHGKQRKEVAELTDWLADEVKPDAVILTNALLSGIIPELVVPGRAGLRHPAGR